MQLIGAPGLLPKKRSIPNGLGAWIDSLDMTMQFYTFLPSVK
jgi:hypothetical protein